MVVTRPSGETAGTPRVDPHGEQDRWLIGEGKNGFQELLRCQPTSRRESFEKGEHKTVFPTARENHPESRAGRPKELLCPLASGEERPGHNGVTTPLGVINTGPGHVAQVAAVRLLPGTCSVQRHTSQITTSHTGQSSLRSRLCVWVWAWVCRWGSVADGWAPQQLMQH